MESPSASSPSHPDDLALAAACADGDEAAWDRFVREYRQVLYRSATAIDPAGGRELADSIYAELYGLKERDGHRQSLFRYYQGRSSLATWLRTVLAQRHVDALRARRRIDPLPDDESAVPDRTVAEPDPERPRFFAAMQDALGAALAALAPRDRLRLRCYYTQAMTLATIGRMLGEHESTVSRHLTRARRDIRASVERSLREAHGLRDDEIEECFESVVSDPGTLDLRQLIGEER